MTMGTNDFSRPGRFLALFICMLSMSVLSAEVKLASIFSNGMVLQQEQDIPVWGWGTSGQAVIVKLANQAAEAVVNADGKWRVHLAPLKAGYEEYKLVVQVGGASIIIDDVVVGEVWLCSGQSNMDYPLGPLSKAPKYQPARPIADMIGEEIRAAHDPYLRQLSVDYTTSFREPRDTVQADWMNAEQGNIANFSATAYFFGRELRERLDVPVGLIKSSWGNTQIESWMPKSAFRGNEILTARYDTLVGRLEEKLSGYDEAEERRTYERKREAWEQNGRRGRAPKMVSSPLDEKHNPGTLFNAMIQPLIPYPIRGCIWYQGEANRFLPEHYALKFAAMLQSWRQAWGSEDLSFYAVQLAGFGEPGTSVKGWVEIQHEQFRAMRETRSGMAVTHDIGEPIDIHPHNKIDVGKRLAAWALAKDYGVEMQAFSGPVYNNHTVEGSAILVTFDHTGSGLMAGEKKQLDPAQPTEQPLRHFEIAGADGEWKPAEAEIVSSETVRVSHPDLTKPLHVRYAWTSYPEGPRLYNREGFPASLFSTPVLLE